jgi:hypothetical protein
VQLPRGTSLRDDFAFFLLLARQRLAETPGVLAFVTPSSLLDSFLYAPLRRALLDTLSLLEVLELGPGVFQGTRVNTCVTLWRSPREPGAAHYRTRTKKRGGFSSAQLTPVEPLAPSAPDWLLRPVPARAAALDAAWREEGEALTDLLPISLPGLKTRFDELLVDADRQRLLTRVRDFVAAKPAALPSFARKEEIPIHLVPKLVALKKALPKTLRVRPSAVRPFFRYAGARHRGAIPLSARAYCYLDRALIPRGDHRLRGTFDPHLERIKIVFNLRELPLAAALITEPGCVHDHRHARFAPLRVPERLWREGLGAARRPGSLGPPVLNLSLRGQAWARRLGGPEALLRRLVAFINSPEVQEGWAPTFGALRTLPVNERSLLLSGRVI